MNKTTEERIEMLKKRYGEEYWNRIVKETEALNWAIKEVRK